MSLNNVDRVSRRRYDREKRARAEAEALLEGKSRELYEANLELSAHSQRLENAVRERTTELSDALEKAKAASAARSRFIATMSHEIRTPLGGLLGMIDLLALDETDPEKLDLLKNAQVSGGSLNRIVNDVLDFSKMEAGLFVFQNEDVDIRALVKSVLVLAQTNLTNEGRTVEALIDNAVPQLFVGDGTRIRQVISNLVSNAVRYSSDGPITIRVSATQGPGEICLRLEVEDHGVGIASDKIDSLFKDFSQVSNSLTSAAQGTGLGLAISKRIVEGCGGSIGVVSAVCKGSTFWVELPVTAVEKQAAPSDSFKKEACGKGTPDINGIRILLAEDNAINQKLLLTYLSRMGVDAELAENGRIAVDMFEPGKFDLILMDVAMPEMDGLSATRYMRRTWTADQLPPIIFLTAHVMDAIEEDASSVGVDTVLSKPIPINDLRDAIKQALIRRMSADGKKDGFVLPSETAPPAVVSLMSKDVVVDLMECFSPEQLVAFVQTYVQDSRQRLSLVSEHHASGQYDLMSGEAHSLKGSSRLLGFSALGDIAALIEGQASEIDVVELGELVNRAEDYLTEINDNLISA